MVMAMKGMRKPTWVLVSAAVACLATTGCGNQPRPQPQPQPVVESQRDPGGHEAGREAANSRSRFHFVDVAAEAGLTRVLWCGRPGKDHLLDSAGTGAAFLDYDRDGRLDIYLVNAWRLEGAEVVEKGRNALYRGLADGSFRDVTDEAGVGGEGHWGCGVVAADYDADGWPDLLVTNFGPNVLYRNLGNGSFQNVAAELGIESPGWNTGAALLDAEGDGDLDIYIAAYIDCSLQDVLGAQRTLDWKGVDKVAFGPFGLTGARDHFFLAGPDGHFGDTTVGAGLDDKALGFGFAVRAADFDRDGDSDIYVANDSDANYLYQNLGGGRFREVGLWSGCAFSATGAAQASMGIAVGDANGDGLLDIFVTHFSEDASTFYRGLEGGLFEDATAQMRLVQPTFPMLSWGTGLADLDNDGDLDLVVANGHIYPQVDAHPELGMKYKQRNQIFENREGVFVEVTDDAGPGFQVAESSRGLAMGDYDNDGDVDLLITNLDAPPTLLRNDSPSAAWITIDTQVPPGTPRIGTRVRVTAAGRTQSRDVAAGDSYLSTHDERLHFGLGTADTVDRIEVLWPDGTTSVRTAVPARQRVTIAKGL
jgi:hypothetical protein